MRIHFTPKIGLVPTALFTLPFLAVGSWSVYQAWTLYLQGSDWSEFGVFGVIGVMAILMSLGAVAQAWKYRKAGQRREKLREKYQDAPWKMRSAWRAPRIVADQGEDSGGGLAFAILWNLITWPLAGWILTTELSSADPDRAVFMVLLFPLIGIIAGGFVVRDLLRKRKFGESVLELETMPAPLGGRLRGQLETGVKATSGPDEGFEVNLSCYRRTVRRVRKDGKTRKKVDYSLLWRDEKRMRGIPYGDGSQLAVPVAFDLPDDLPTSTAEKTPSRIVWRVEVEAAVPGIDYAAQVEIPVFDVDTEQEPAGAAPPDAPEEASPEPDDAMFLDLAGPRREADPSSAPAEPEGEAPEDGYAEHEIREVTDGPVSDGIEMRQLPSGGLEFFFDRARNMTTVLVVTVIFLALLAGTGMFVLFAEETSLLLLLFLGVFTVLFGWLTYRQWTYTSTIRIEKGRISVVQGPFGRGEPTVFPCAELAQVKVSVSGQTNEKAQYRLEAMRSSPETEREAAKGAGALDEMASMLGASDAQAADGTSIVGQMKKATTDAMKSVKIADDLDNKAEADWIAAKIEEVAARQARRVRA